MKKLSGLIVFFSILCNISVSQCLVNESHTITPAGPYSPGQVVTVNYNLGYFYQLNINLYNYCIWFP